MKKSTIISLVTFLVLMPLTLYFGTTLSGKGYYIIATLIIVEMMIPFFATFEGRKPQARELVVIAVLCAIAIASRVAIPIPHFKPTFAIIMLSGIAFGPQTGFMVGAITAFGSDFFAGQGAFTPWQMMAYGAGGLLAGIASQKGWIKKEPIPLAIFGFFAVALWVGPLLDTCAILVTPMEHTWTTAKAWFLSGIPVNLTQAACTVLTMLLFSRPLLEKLDRIKIKYGMMEADDGI